MFCRLHLARVQFELTTLVVIGTDWIGSYKSNYNTITTTTVSLRPEVHVIITSTEVHVIITSTEVHVIITSITAESNVFIVYLVSGTMLQLMVVWFGQMRITYLRASIKKYFLK